MCRIVRASVAPRDDRGGRPRGGHPGHRRHDRRRPHRARRRHFLDAPLPGRRRHRAHPPSGDRLRLRRAHDGHARCRSTKGTTAATIIPSVGCPMGCNFCTTSAFFGGKGKYLNFYDTGDGTVSASCADMEARLGVKSFFMMDENFLLHKRRAMELLDRMKARQQGLVAVRLLVGQRDRPVFHARTGGTGRFLDLDGPGIAALGVRQAEGRRHPAADARTAPARHQAAGLHHRRPGTPHARRTSTRRSSTRWRTTPISTSSCCTRRCPARRCSPR